MESPMNNKKKQEPWWKHGMEVFAGVTAWIVGPIIASLYLGNWLDHKYHTANKYLLICVGVAFIVTNIGLVSLTLQAQDKLKKTETKKEENYE